METITVWQDRMAFSSTFDGHTIQLNGETGTDGKRLGFGPKALLLSGLAGCSGIDVVEILNKMKVPFTKFEIACNADVVEEHPKVFKDIHIIYRINADKRDEDKVRRAIDLSLEKYCGVAGMLRKNSAIIPTLEFID